MIKVYGTTAIFGAWRSFKNQPPNVDPKSGLAVMVQCGGTLAKACFRGRDFYVVLEAVGRAHQEHQEHLRSAQGGFWKRLSNSLKSSDLEGSAVRQHDTHKGAPVSRILTSRNLPAIIFHKICRSNAKSRPNCAHDAGVRRAKERARRTGASPAQLGLLYSPQDASLKIAR